MLIENVYKIIVVGDSSVGKTNLISRFCWNKLPKKTILDNFILSNDPTVAIEFCSQDIILNIENQKIIGKIWDTAGQERYHSITKFYYRGANGVLLVYDISQRKSFENLDHWIKEIREIEPDVIILLIGNKIDIKERQTQEIEAKEYCKINSLFYMETSSILNINIVESFEILLEQVYIKFKKNRKEIKKEIIPLHSDIQNNSSCSCLK